MESGRIIFRHSAFLSGEPPFYTTCICRAGQQLSICNQNWGKRKDFMKIALELTEK